jgi:hypothetical protein
VSTLAAESHVANQMSTAIRGRLGMCGLHSTERHPDNALPGLPTAASGCQPPRCVCYSLGTKSYYATWKPETVRGDINLEPTAA